MERVLQGPYGAQLHASVEVVVEVLGPDVHYPEEKLLAQLLLIENNLSIYTL